MTTIRDEREDDGDAVLEVVRRAFGADGEEVAAIWAELRASGTVRASLVTEVDGRWSGLRDPGLAGLEELLGRSR